MDNPPAYNDAVKNAANPTAPVVSAQPPFNPNYNAGWNQPSQHPQQAHAPVQQFGQPLSQPYAMVQQQPVVIINQQTLFGPDPTMTTCHQCKQSTVSRLDYENSIMTHVLAGVLCMMCFCPCAVIPYCIDGTKDVIHKCSKCNAYLGTYRRSSSGRRRY